MRRFRTITLALCAMALAMGGTSCKKEKENNIQGGDRMVIGASIEQGGSKTEIGPENNNQMPVLWSANDSFTLYAKDNTTGSKFTIQDGDEGSTSAQFEGEKPEGDAPYLAMYPTDGSYNGDKTFCYTIPARQDSYNINHAGPMVGYSADGESASFQNAASWIRVGLKGTATVDKVVLTYKTSGKPRNYPPLFGTLTITVNDDGTIKKTEISSGSSKEIPTLTLNKTAKLGDDYTYFDFLVPEGAFDGINGINAVFTVLDTNDKTLATIEKGIPCILRGKVYVIDAPSPIPDGTLPGAFTISDDGQKIHFSQGNLYYDGTNWGFEEEQFKFSTYPGKGKCDKDGYSKDSGAANNRWGLFGWSTENKNFGMSTSTSSDDYSGDFYDWGKTIGDGNTWRTLTIGEWEYLFAHHVNKWGSCGFITGRFIAPDGFAGDLSAAINDWKKAEAAGIVFLPAMGFRDGSTVESAPLGCYWSSENNGSTKAYCMKLNGQNASSSNDDRYYGYSVRLVTESE